MTDAPVLTIAPIIVAPTLTYARRRTISHSCGNVRKWHIYVDGVPQCRHAPALGDAHPDATQDDVNAAAAREFRD